jgi:hypothetical protein
MKPKSAPRCLVALAIAPLATAATSDATSSFFFAETLNYLLLLLGPPNPINLKANMLDTEEAHSLRRSWQPPNGRQSAAAG